MRTVKKLIFYIALSLSATGISAKTLRLFVWEDYFPQELLDGFYQQTGYRIEQVNFSSDIDRDRRLYAGFDDYDVVLADARTLHLYRDTGILKSINKNALRNIKNIDTRWVAQCGEMGVPLIWAGLGIVYRSDKVSGPVTSWKQLLQPDKELQGHISMLNETFDLLVPALLLNGHSVNSYDKQHLRAAYHLLKQQNPHVLTYSNAPKAEQMYPDELYMAQAYTGDEYILSEATGHDWVFTYADEGSSLWVDCLAINANSAKESIALKFIDYFLNAKIATNLAETTGTATTNKAAMQFVGEDYKNDHTIFIKDSILEHSELLIPPPRDIQHIRTKILQSLENTR